MIAGSGVAVALLASGVYVLDGSNTMIEAVCCGSFARRMNEEIDARNRLTEATIGDQKCIQLTSKWNSLHPIKQAYCIRQ